MPLGVAMALSGIEPEHFDENLMPMYKQGSDVALSTPKLYSAAMRSLSSASSSSSSSSSTNVPSSYTSSESGISSQTPQSDDTCDTFDDNLSLHNIYELLVRKLITLFEMPDANVKKHKTDEPDTPKTKVMYEGRDILDLGANLRGPDFCQPSQLLPLNTIDNKYFDNRSPCSRLMNAFPPRHINITCNFEKCDFVMQCYFD